MPLPHLATLLTLCLLFSSLSRNSEAQIYADFETSAGNFTLEMFYQDQPLAVANFIGLADGTIPWFDYTTNEIKTGVPYYNGIIFHRVIQDFMIQAGSKNSLGNDDPGYSFADRFARDKTGTLIHPHDQQGIISMANAGVNTNGSQFFITDVPTPWLDGVHVVFGKIAAGIFGTAADGISVITTMNNVATTSNRPNIPLVINNITIRREGKDATAFDVLAQGVPILSELPLDINVSPTSAELAYDHTNMSSVDIYRSPDLKSWTFDSSSYFHVAGSPTKDITSIINANTRQFFKAISIDYAGNPQPGGPTNLENTIVHLAFNNVPDIDLQIDATGADGTWSFPPANTTAGTLQSFTYTRGTEPYFDEIIVIYDDLVANFTFRMTIDLSFDTPSSGRFRGTTNGNPANVSGTFETEPQP